MAAWLIVTAVLHDRAAFMAGYSPAAAKVVDRFGGRFIVRGGGAEVLEGDGVPGSSQIVIEFPDADTARAFWNDPEYRAAKALRAGVCDMSVVLASAPQPTT